MHVMYEVYFGALMRHLLTVLLLCAVFKPDAAIWLDADFC